jgi:hypothetical protein
VVYQNAGALIVTFARGCHQGFNLGLNFAEATNFGTRQWVKFAMEALQCTCQLNARAVVTFSTTPFDER